MLGWPKICRLAHAFLCKHSYKRAEVGPTSGPTWRLSHFGIADAIQLARAAVVDVVRDEDEAPGGDGDRVALDQRPLQLAQRRFELRLPFLRIWCVRLPEVEVIRPGEVSLAGARKVLDWPKMYQLAHALPW